MGFMLTTLVCGFGYGFCLLVSGFGLCSLCCFDLLCCLNLGWLVDLVGWFVYLLSF